MAIKGKVLNIEIGDRLTKVCLTIPKGASFLIKESFLFQTPDNAVQDGVIAMPEALAAALTGQLEIHGVKDVKRVVFSLTSGKVASREVQLPPCKDSRLQSVIDANKADYFPVDMSKYHITYSLLERVTTGEEPGCRVLVIAAPLQLLEGYFKVASLSGLRVEAVDFSGNSQYQALRGLKAEGVTMYVNVDCNSSLVTFMQDGRLLMQRAFTFGGDELILGYLTAAGEEDYVKGLKVCTEEDPAFLRDGTMSPESAADNLSRLVSSIIRSSDYFNSNRWETTVERVVLMGPCAHLAGLRDMVANGTGVPTDYLDSMKESSGLANSASGAACYISCIGSSIAPLDFIPPQFKEDKKKKAPQAESLRGGIFICVLCFLAAVGLSLSALLGYFSARDDRDAAKEKIAQMEPAKAVYEQYTQYLEEENAVVSLDETISTPNDDLLAFLSELEEKMPSGVLLLSAVCSQESVSMSIDVPAYDEVAVTLSQLRTFESLGTITMSTVTETVDETGGSYVSFAVSCSYAAVEAEAAEAAAAAAAAQTETAQAETEG